MARYALQAAQALAACGVKCLVDRLQYSFGRRTGRRQRAHPRRARHRCDRAWSGGRVCGVPLRPHRRHRDRRHRSRRRVPGRDRPAQERCSRERRAGTVVRGAGGGRALPRLHRGKRGTPLPGAALRLPLRPIPSRYAGVGLHALSDAGGCDPRRRGPRGHHRRFGRDHGPPRAADAGVAEISWREAARGVCDCSPPMPRIGLRGSAGAFSSVRSAPTRSSSSIYRESGTVRCPADQSGRVYGSSRRSRPCS